MTKSLQIEPKHLEIVKNVLKKYPYKFYAFGSRVNGTPRKFSDLDICFFDEIPWNIQAHLDNDFEESDLPYKVDVVNWNTIDESFKKNIKSDLTPIEI